jgi:hypothetical protein
VSAFEQWLNESFEVVPTLSGAAPECVPFLIEPVAFDDVHVTLTAPSASVVVPALAVIEPPLLTFAFSDAVGTAIAGAAQRPTTAATATALPSAVPARFQIAMFLLSLLLARILLKLPRIATGEYVTSA